MISFQPKENSTEAEKYLIDELKKFINQLGEACNLLTERVEIIFMNNSFCSDICSDAACDREASDNSRNIAVFLSPIYLKRVFLLTCRLYNYYLYNIQRKGIVDFISPKANGNLLAEKKHIKNILSINHLDERVLKRKKDININQMLRIFHYQILFYILHEIAHNNYSQNTNPSIELCCDQDAQKNFFDIVEKTGHPEIKGDAKIGILIAQINIGLYSLFQKEKLDNAIKETSIDHPTTIKRVKSLIENDESAGYDIDEKCYSILFLYIIIIYDLNLKKIISKKINFDQSTHDALKNLEEGNYKSIFLPKDNQ